MEQEIDYKGYKIKIVQDEGFDSPNDWLNDERFLVFEHRDFNIKREGFKPQDIYYYINGANYPTYKDYYIFQVEAYIHSSVSLSLFNGIKQCQWDSSVTGFVLIKKEDTTEEQAKEYAERLIETWNQYLSGEIYGFQIWKEDKCSYCDTITEENIDSCYGFYGDPEESGCIDEAKSIIDNLVKE